MKNPAILAPWWTPLIQPIGLVTHKRGSKYMPHQSKRECARRLRQRERGIIKCI